jgi:hypothetical protein
MDFRIPGKGLKKLKDLELERTAQASKLEKSFQQG